MAGATPAGVCTVLSGLPLLQCGPLPPACAAGGTALSWQWRAGVVTVSVAPCLAPGDHPVPAGVLLALLAPGLSVSVLHHRAGVCLAVLTLQTTLVWLSFLEAVAAPDTGALLGLVPAGDVSPAAGAGDAGIGVSDARHLHSLPLPSSALHILSVQTLAGHTAQHKHDQQEDLSHAGSSRHDPTLQHQSRTHRITELIKLLTSTHLSLSWSSGYSQKINPLKSDCGDT